jgi:rhodanese-related sulfurtransferase
VGRALIPLLVAALLLGAAAPAAPPEYPVAFVTVDELQGALDRGLPADVIDVRARGEFDELHIKGARSMPLPSVADRIGEIPRTGLVVFY